ncbi:MAG: CvpA family protein [Planctomycetes bacterium]|nr:CvpA family protein [Planctomycetota bacterium]
MFTTLTWLDWVTLTLLAFALGAGFGRGFAHQFSRLLVILAAIAACIFLTEPARWTLEALGLRIEADSVEGARLPTSLFFLSLPGLYWVRRLLYRIFEGPVGSVGSRVFGILVGLSGAMAVSAILTLGVKVWGYSIPTDQKSPASWMAIQMGAGLTSLPSWAQTHAWAWFPEQPAQADNSETDS